MDEVQAQDLQKVVNWCSRNLSPLANTGKGIKEMAQICMENAFSSETPSIHPEVAENYIKACLTSVA